MNGVMGIILYFYTEKLLLSVGFVSAVLTIPRVLEAITDIVMGNIIDKHKFKNDRYRPWLLWCAVPLGLAMILTFIMPTHLPKAVTGIYIVLGSLFVQGIFGTAIYVAYYALLGARTKSNEERGKLNLSRMVFSIVVAVFGSILYIPIANMLGGDRKAYIILTSIYAVAISISVLITYWGSKGLPEEKKLGEKETKENLFENVKLLFKNPYWVRLTIVAICIQLVTSIQTAGGTYYAKYIFGDDNIATLAGISSVGLTLIAIFREKLGGTKLMRISRIIGVAGLVIRTIFPSNLILYMVGAMLATLASVTTWSFMIVFTNNCAEYNALHFGRPMRAISNSSNSFAQKLSTSLGMILTGFIMSLTGYDATLTTQPATINTSFVWINSILPAILYIICLAAFLKFDLDKQYPEIVRQLYGDSSKSSIKQG